MKLNFFKKEKTGWELIDLMDHLQNKASKLLTYSKSYTLSAINPTEDRFVIIRKFAARVYEGKIDMLNAADVEGGEYYPISQSGMTLVSVTKLGASSNNVILPNTLQYESVELEGETINIHHSGGTTTTNFKEINRLWTLDNLTEEEILERFNALTNHVEEPQEVDRHTGKSIKDDFFGELILDGELDWYQAEKDGIEFFFHNTLLKKLRQNFKSTQQIIPQFKKIEEAMVEEMLILKNESWLEEGEQALSKAAFQKDISLYVVNTEEDGGIELYYKAENLFWGHEILVSLDEDLSFESSTLVG